MGSEKEKNKLNVFRRVLRWFDRLSRGLIEPPTITLGGATVITIVGSIIALFLIQGRMISAGMEVYLHQRELNNVEIVNFPFAPTSDTDYFVEVRYRGENGEPVTELLANRNEIFILLQKSNASVVQAVLGTAKEKQQLCTLVVGGLRHENSLPNILRATCR